MRGRSGSLKIATIRGVELRLHFTLIFLLFYVVFVAALQFPLVVFRAGLSLGDLSVGPFISGFIFALGLFLSVALHEYGHVWVAQSQGVPVRGVTLMMLGGVSEMERMPDTPYAEFKLAVAGPLVSLFLGGLLWFIRSESVSAEVNLFTYWLGNANLILAIFNLLPAFPLDGGRALRSLLAVRQGRMNATQTSVRVSKVFAWCLGLLGFWSFNLILMLVAFFIYHAAENELFMLMSEGALKGLRVGEVMVRAAPISSEVNLREAARQMFQTQNRILPVQTDSEQSALLSISDLKRVSPDLWQKTQVRDVMLAGLKALNINDSISQVFNEIALNPLRALPVEDQGTAVGVIHYSDLTELIQLRSLEESSAQSSKAA